MGIATVSKIVRVTSECLWRVLQPIHMKNPTEEMFKDIAERFYERCDFPNCIGALGGKDVRFKCGSHSGSAVLQAVCDANCRFVAVDVYTRYDKQDSDGTFRDSALYDLINKKKFKFPSDDFLPHSDQKMPFVFVANEEYPLLRHLLKPYPSKTLSSDKEIYNNNLSRARRMVDCSFAMINNKWRILDPPVGLSSETTNFIVKAICILHNVILDKEGNSSTELKDVPVPEASRLLLSRSFNRASVDAIAVRNSFKEYFCTTTDTTT